MPAARMIAERCSARLVQSHDGEPVDEADAPASFLAVLQDIERELIASGGGPDPELAGASGAVEAAFPGARLVAVRKLKILTLRDEYTRECRALRVDRRLGSGEVIETRAAVMIRHGIPAYLRSDNGPEFIANELRHWLSGVGAAPLYIEPGSPWENGYCESFNGKLRDECLNGEIFYSLREAQSVIEQWRIAYNTKRPHSALGYRPPHPKRSARQKPRLPRRYMRYELSHFSWSKRSLWSIATLNLS
jgi:putative transposase